MINIKFRIFITNFNLLVLEQFLFLLFHITFLTSPKVTISSD